jgi:hypothetical protein
MTYGSCIQARSHLRPIISVDAGFLSDRHACKFFIIYAYDAYQKLLPLIFAVADEESTHNWR